MNCSNSVGSFVGRLLLDSFDILFHDFLHAFKDLHLPVRTPCSRFLSSGNRLDAGAAGGIVRRGSSSLFLKKGLLKALKDHIRALRAL